MQPQVELHPAVAYSPSGFHHCHTPLRLLSFVDVTGHSCGLHDSSDCAELPLILL